jgi:hypothetical protein
MAPFPKLHDLERMHGITWHELVDLEPRLARLLWESRQAGENCRNRPDADREFASIRNTLAELVGFARRHRWHPVLSTLGAYEVAYWKLYGTVAALVPARDGLAEAVKPEHRRRTAVGNYSKDLAVTALAEV